MMYEEHIVFNVGRTFLSDHFAGRNARVTLLKPKRLTLGVAVANLAEKQNIKMAFPLFEELWKLIDLLVRKDFRQANLAYKLENGLLKLIESLENKSYEGGWNDKLMIRESNSSYSA